MEHKHGNIFMNTENSKTNEPHKFFFKLPQRLELRNSDKHVAFQNVSIYNTWKDNSIKTIKLK